MHTGPIVDMKDSLEVGSIKYRQIGSRDIYSLIKTGEMYAFDVTFTPINDTLIKYGINLPNGTGTIEKSLSFLKSQTVNGSELYTLYTGCRCDSIDITIASDGAVQVKMTFIARSISTPATTSGLSGTPSYATNPTTIPWNNTTPGSDPFTVNGVAVDTGKFSCSVTNNLEVVKPNGEVVAKFVEPTLRDVKFDFDTWYKDTTILADVKTLTARAMEYKLSTDRKLVFTDAYMEKLAMSDATSATKTKIQSFSGIAQAVTISSY